MSFHSSLNHNLGVIILLDWAKVEVGIKIGEERWCYRLAIGVAIGGSVMLQEGLREAF